MNIKRGLFRAWITMSALWCAGVGAIAFTIVPSVVQNARYSYVHVLKKDFPPGPDGLPENVEDWVIPPRDVKEQPMFSEIELRYIDDWEKRGKDGRMVVTNYAGKLFLPIAISEVDRVYLREAFKQQSWRRWSSAALPFFWIAVVPVIVVFGLGAAAFWVARGFRAS